VDVRIAILLFKSRQRTSSAPNTLKMASNTKTAEAFTGKALKNVGPSPRKNPRKPSCVYIPWTTETKEGLLMWAKRPAVATNGCDIMRLRKILVGIENKDEDGLLTS
jgi:hypothetical protein